MATFFGSRAVAVAVSRTLKVAVAWSWSFAVTITIVVAIALVAAVTVAITLAFSVPIALSPSLRSIVASCRSVLLISENNRKIDVLVYIWISVLAVGYLLLPRSTLVLNYIDLAGGHHPFSQIIVTFIAIVIIIPVTVGVVLTCPHRRSRVCRSVVGYSCCCSRGCLCDGWSSPSHMAVVCRGRRARDGRRASSRSNSCCCRYGCLCYSWRCSHLLPSP